MKKALKTAARGTVFPYAGEKWVVLEHEPAGRTLCLRLDLIPNKPFDENNCNNFATSSSKEWMNGPLPRQPDRRREGPQRLPPD